jgi:CheY-like chemotaxis protein
VSNAVKFTERGEVNVTVIRKNENDTLIELGFMVQDTGIGIPPETQSRLFQPFSQADGSMTRKYGGMGLGLVIVKQLVELLQGQLGADSAPGKGSTFWFTLTFEKTRPPTATSAAPVALNPALKGLRVLVVDQEADHQQRMAEQLAGWQMRVQRVANGSDALKQLRREAIAYDPFNLVILALMIPGIDGLTLARAIHTEPALTSTRIILLTPPGQPIESESQNESGVNACLEKPVPADRLLQCLTAVIQNG